MVRHCHWKMSATTGVCIKPGLVRRPVMPQSKFTELCSSATVVSQSKSTELCISAAVVPESKSTELCSLAVPLDHDL